MGVKLVYKSGCARTPNTEMKIMSDPVQTPPLRYHDYYGNMSYADFLTYQADPDAGEPISMNGRGL